MSILVLKLSKEAEKLHIRAYKRAKRWYFSSVLFIVCSTSCTHRTDGSQAQEEGMGEAVTCNPVRPFHLRRWSCLCRASGGRCSRWWCPQRPRPAAGLLRRWSLTAQCSWTLPRGGRPFRSSPGQEQHSRSQRLHHPGESLVREKKWSQIINSGPFHRDAAQKE